MATDRKFHPNASTHQAQILWHNASVVLRDISQRLNKNTQTKKEGNIMHLDESTFDRGDIQNTGRIRVRRGMGA